MNDPKTSRPPMVCQNDAQTGLTDHSLFLEQDRSFNLLEESPFPILISRLRDGRILYTNPRFERQLKCSREELRTRSTLEFYRDPADREAMLTQVCKQGSLTDWELHLVDANGTPLEVILSTTIIQYENEPALLSATNDVTRRKQIEEELRWEQSKFQTVFRSIPDLVWLKDENGVYLACNHAFERLYGASQTAIVGKTDYDFVSQALADFFRANDRKALEANEPLANEEWLTFADGSYQGLFETIKTPIYKKDGARIGVLGIARDITDRRRIERDLRERIKEQQCLYAISALTEAIEEPLVNQLHQLVQLVGPGWQFPVITVARIECADLCAASANFQETPWMQIAETVDQRGTRIRLTVAYLQECPQEDEGPFLKEERRLAEAIVHRLAESLDRRKSFELIQERDQLLATMFAQATDAIVLVDHATLRFVEFNEVAHQGLGYSREEFARLGVMDIQADYSSSQIQEIMTGAVKGQAIHLETHHRHKNGTLREVALTLRPTLLNERRLLSAVWQDITEHKARERKIKDSAERLRLQNWILGQITTAQSMLEGNLHVFSGDVTALLGDIFKIGRVSVWLTDTGQAAPICLDQYEAAFSRHSHRGCLDGETMRVLALQLASSRSLAIDDVRTDERVRVCAATALLPLGITSLLYCSIVSSGRQRGLLCLEQVGNTHAWELDEIAFGCQIADHLGMVLLNKERLEALRQLQDSEKRLQGITDSALDAILMIDPTGAISYWNTAAERILGYSSEEAMGQNLHQLLAPARYQAKHETPFLEFQHTGLGEAVGKTLELAAIRQDGQEITISLSMSAVRLNDAWHAVGIVRDITEQKRQQAELQAALAEAAQVNREKNELLAHLEELVTRRTEELHLINEQLRSSQERYTLALDATTDGLWDWNIAQGSAYLSPAYFRMLGYEPNGLSQDTQSHFLDLLHPDDRERIVTTAFARLRNEGSYEMEFRMRSKSGQYIWVLSRGKTVARDAAGQPTRAVGIHTDLTSRKQIELELRTANEEQRAIFESAAVGIVFIKDRRILRCNRQLERIFGCDPGAFLGETTRCWYADEDEFEEVGQQVGQQLREQGRHHVERQLMHKDGHRFWARMTAQALDPHDLSKGLVGMVEDITEERRASAALIQAKEAAEAATRAKSEFLANMSHEIRTPMNAIIGFAHLLKRDPLTPRQSAQLAKLTDASRHLLRIINDILDISKIEASKMTLEIEDFEMARVIDHVCSIVAGQVAEKQLHLHVDLDHIPAMLRGDGARLGQVLLNLISNSVKFTEKGQIDVIGTLIDEEENQVRVRFEIRDTGIGMSGEQLQRIFVAFEQADSSTTRRFGGTGLGLAISQRLVELLGGAIGCESAPGQGTLFWVELPFVRSTRTPTSRLAVHNLRDLHVLVIDDDTNAREIVAAMLTELGMRVDTTTTGESGLEAVKQADRNGDAYQLLIIDWQLPGLNGVETSQQLQQIALNSHPAFLIMTAYGDQLAADQATGIHKVMSKPVTPSILHDTLTEILQPPLHYEQPGEAIAEELAKRRGAHILLVEDNPINQEVGQTLLESLGMQVSLADNGKTAVDMVSAAPFDLVCMDIQMPVMDGLQAARAIRAMPSGETIPIVAMTANAFSEDRKQCLEAGMNDHIAKPIEQEALERLLIQWLPVKEQQSTATSAVSPEQIPGQSINLVEQIAGLDAKAGLKRLLGDEQRYLRLLARFAQDHGRDGELLTQLYRAEEQETLWQKAHALKGTAATLGIDPVHQEAAALEAMVKNDQAKTALRVQIDRLQQALDTFTKAITAVLCTPQPVPQPIASTELDWQAVIAHLSALADLLHMGDTAVADLFAQAKPQLLAAFGPLTEQLEGQIQSFEYQEALDTLHRMHAQGQHNAAAN